MAFDTYDGITTTVDVSVDLDGAGGGAATSIKCIWRVVTTDIQQDLFVYTTFCSTVWETVREGAKRMFFTLLGYVSGGSVYSAPGSLMGLAAATIFTIQYNTGCTITFAPRVGRDQNTTVAMGETARVVEGRSSGAPTIVWVTV
jgi:hypothetical protein